MHANVTEWLDETAARFPERLALHDEWESLTYREYHDKAVGIAKEILNKGIGPRRPVVVYLEKSAKVLVSFMGIAKSGNF